MPFETIFLFQIWILCKKKINAQPPPPTPPTHYFRFGFLVKIITNSTPTPSPPPKKKKLFQFSLKNFTYSLPLSQIPSPPPPKEKKQKKISFSSPPLPLPFRPLPPPPPPPAKKKSGLDSLKKITYSSPLCLRLKNNVHIKNVYKYKMISIWFTHNSPIPQKKKKIFFFGFEFFVKQSHFSSQSSLTFTPS